MNLATISFAYLKARSLNTLLNILLLALGVVRLRCSSCCHSTGQACPPPGRDFRLNGMASWRAIPRF